MTELVKLPSASPARMADFIGQATAVEQARAVAEVQAAVVVAQQVPRDMGRAEADMRDACGRLGLANRAFYSIPRKGSKPITGATVHLARELARIFGNVQYGVHELRRDDGAGISEIQAFAWDVERNVRSTRTFVVPHQRMAGGARQKIVDLGEVYLNNQNVGARAVRECIFTILPAWFTDASEDLCRKTLEHGEGKPLPERIDEMIRVFADINVRVDQLEQKIGRKRSSWTPHDVAEMGITYRSIQRHEITVEDEFPQQRVTAAEITAQRTPQTAGEDGESSPAVPTPPKAWPREEPMSTSSQIAQLTAQFARLRVNDISSRLAFAAALADRDGINAPGELTQAQAQSVIDQLARLRDRAELENYANSQEPLQ